MKKFLFLFLVLGLYLNTAAQVIDLVGVGMVGETTKTLTFTEQSTIEKVTVYAMFKGKLNDYEAPAGEVTFNGIGYPTTKYKDYTFIDARNPEAYGPGGTDPYIGYWTTEFGSINSVTALTTVAEDRPYVLSTYAWVYHTKLPFNTTFKSYESTEIVFLYHNGASAPYIYNIPIEAASAPRDITVKIPISELDGTSRMVIIDIAAGSATFHAEETTWNSGESFFLGTYTLSDVPAGVTNVSVSIYSPNWNEGNGDSFFVNGVIVDVDIVYGGCTLTQGYWKTHGFDAKKRKFDNTWDMIGEHTSFFSSGITYYQAINEKAKGNAYYILAHQYIAAQLNFLNGANPADALQAFDAATQLFNTYTPNDIKGLAGNDPVRQAFIAAKDVLDDYNNGFNGVGPGHCDDKSTIANIDSDREQLNIYPNPMSSNGTIEFTVLNEAQTTVEMYNLMGQRVASLFDQPAQVGQQYKINLDASRYDKGLYIIYIRNGSITLTSKVNIN